MGIGVSLFLIAVGAILTWAVEVQVQGVELDTIGVILMVVGAVGLLWSLVVWGPRRRVRSERVEDDRGRGYRRVEHVDEGL
jgi:hypothetical protein